jgi:2-C-methyl-D-erythritol 2,4-cyclodiphosphate synthase
VLVHDAARPIVGRDTIDRVLEGIMAHGAAAPGLPVTDTLKRVREDGSVSATVDRGGLWTVQTPQGARRELLEKAYALAGSEKGVPTDECALLERSGVSPHIVMGDPRNIKITVPSDLDRAEELLSAEGRHVEWRHECRTGLGFDVHRLVEGRPLWLGGVRIDHPRGLLGHSDADVVMHAVSDAVLGAIGGGDIGMLFPDTDPANKGRRSREFVSAVVAMAASRGWRLAHLDVTLAADEPRLGPHRQAMREALADAASIAGDCISIKATTCEGLGFVGRREGIACWSVATLTRHAQAVREHEDEGGR